MSDYTPTERFSNVQFLYGNHYRFVLDALPDLTFYVQSVTLPSISSPAVGRANPFVEIKEVGDHLHFETLSVNYAVDVQFKSYFSLFYWMKGYGFPKSWEDIEAFKQNRLKRLGNPRPQRREIEKTNATLTVLDPNEEHIIATVMFEDVFPIQVGQLQFATTDSDAPMLTSQAAFAYSDFDIALTS